MATGFSRPPLSGQPDWRDRSTRLSWNIEQNRFAALLKQQQQEGAKLDQQIARNLAWLGFDLP
jgi:hypothetical protein